MKKIVLDPKISHKDLFKMALESDSKTRISLLRQLDLYRKIYHWLGQIERPDFEGGTNHMVRRKYVPNDKHEAFYRAANKREGKGRWLLGGNRSGKTETGVREDVSFAIGFRPFLDRSDPDYFTPIPPPTTIRIFCEDWEKAAKSNIVPKLYSVIPPELLKSVRKASGVGVENDWRIKVPFDATGKVSSIEVVTNKADVRSIEGWRGDAIHFDEPTRKNMFIAATRGLVDTDGYFWFTLTPLNEPWILDDIVNNHDYIGFYVSSFENIYNPDTGAGFLTEDGIDSFARKMTETEKKTRLYGEFAHLSGRVFTDFDPYAHVYPNQFVKIDKIPETWWRDCYIDPAKRKPHCVTFVAWSPEGDAYVYDGFRIGDPRYSEDFPDVVPAVPTATELISEIKKRCNPYPQRFFVDPLADTPDWDTGTSLLELLSDEFPIEKWSKIEKEAALGPLRTMMAPDVSGRPKIFINCEMTRAIWEVERYRWDEYAPSSVRKYKPKVIKEDDDYVDCMIAAAQNPPPDFDDDDVPEPQVFFQY